MISGSTVSGSTTTFRRPTFSTNDIEMERSGVLNSQVIGLLPSISAARHVRAGRIVPLVLEHVVNHMRVPVLYGSRRPQPAPGRQLIDFALVRWQTKQIITLET